MKVNKRGRNKNSLKEEERKTHRRRSRRFCTPWHQRPIFRSNTLHNNNNIYYYNYILIFFSLTQSNLS